MPAAVEKAWAVAGAGVVGFKIIINNVVMIYAIHEEKRSVDFYKNMATQCSGAPMEKIFKLLYADEEKHLARLEELYESVYLKEM